jgi:hypothetical protein
MNQKQPDFVPFVVDENEIDSTIIDAYLAKNASKEELQKMKAVEHTINFLKNRMVAGPETIEKNFNMFYKLLTQNGTREQELH